MIYKIFRENEWTAFEKAGVTSGAPIDLTDGYIHLSTGAQVAETVSKYFAATTDLRILALSPEHLGDKLIWEPSRGGALFPHLYRDMTMADVVWAKDLPLGSDGQHIFPDGVLV